MTPRRHGELAATGAKVVVSDIDLAGAERVVQEMVVAHAVVTYGLRTSR